MFLPIQDLETRANEDAANALIPKAELESFIRRVSPLYSKSGSSSLLIGFQPASWHYHWAASETRRDWIQRPSRLVGEGSLLHHRDCPYGRMGQNDHRCWNVGERYSAKSKRVHQQPSREVLYLIEAYKSANNVDDAIDPSEVVDWVFDRGMYSKPPSDPKKLLRREIVRALRAEYITDPQGREVRKNHPVVISDGERRMSIWSAITTASSRHQHISLQQRRNGIRADCRQHKLDFDSYNDNNVHQAQLLPFDYNFNADLQEMNFPTEYPDDKPEE